MSQHDYDIANQTFPNTRSDLNLALKALASTSSGTSVPSTVYASQLWYDSSANILYIRNEDNDANITIMELNQSNDTVEYFKSNSIRTALIEFTDGDDALTIGDGGTLTTSSSLDVNGNELILDADGDTSITADTDDQIDIKIAGADDFQFTANKFLVQTGSVIDINGTELILDADADTSITADTDDQIDFKIAGVEHISLTDSSGDTVIKPRVDAKDIIFQQFDGTSILEINDGAYAKFTSAGIVPESTLTDEATITWNSLTQSVAKVTLTDNRTIGLASGGVTGAFISLLIIQDATGSRTVTWNADYEFTGDEAPTLTTTANKGDLFVFRYNGAKWLETGRNLNLTLS